MCGLVGIVCNNMFPDHKKAFRLLLWLDEKRGRHSTGVCIVNNKKEATVAKEVGGSFSLYYSDKDNKVFEKTGLVREFNPMLLMGHNRHATVGEINEENAHPFNVNGRIIGAHNGTLTRGSAYNKLKHYHKDKVDSLVLYEELYEDDGNMVETYPKIDGAMALTWVDLEKNTFNIAKNSQRPLYVAYLKDNSGFVYASEPWMLEAVFYDYPSLFIPTNIKHADFNFEVTPIPNNVWFQVELHKIRDCMLDKEALATKLTPYTPPVYTHHHNQNFQHPRNVYGIHNHPTYNGHHHGGTQSTGSSYRGFSGGKKNKRNLPKVRGNKETGFFLRSKSLDNLPDPRDLYSVFGQVIDWVVVTSGPQRDRGKWYPDLNKNQWYFWEDTEDTGETGNNLASDGSEPLYVLWNHKLKEYDVVQDIIEEHGCVWCGNRDIEASDKNQMAQIRFWKHDNDEDFFCNEECARAAMNLDEYGYEYKYGGI